MTISGKHAGGLGLGVLLALVASVSVASAAPLAMVPGDVAPEVRGDTSLGQRKVVDFSETRLTLLNFWATWCEPCKQEMPVLEELHQTREDLQVIGVMHDSVENEQMQAFLESLGVSYTVVRPLLRVTKAYGGVGALPTTILIDSDGRVVRRYVGATEEQLEGLIRDVDDALAGRKLKEMVFPDRINAVTDLDRPK